MRMMGGWERGGGNRSRIFFLHAARVLLGRDVGGENGNGKEGEVSDGQREERAKGLVFEDAIPGVQAGKRAGMKGTLCIFFL